ncbi:MAG: L,D-transpeptidase [Solirubrobacterales bacterium]|nr:L,D-transpeptidase [Solirubrobacterales bacterium]
MRRLVILAAVVVAFTAGQGSALASAPASRLPTRWAGLRITPLDAVQPAAVRATAPPRVLKPRKPSQQVLSDERTFTRWAYVNQTDAIFARPDASSHRVARLHWNTEDGFPEVYLLLDARWDRRRVEWVKLRIPMRPNGRTGWVRRDDLGDFHFTRTLVVVDREHLRLSFYAGGRRQWSAPVGVGKPSTPTPAGTFWIRERFKISDPRSGYWPYAFGTADYSTLTDWPGGGVVGIHGPYYEPGLIPGHISHGCIRLGVADDAWLARHVGVGTPVRVV